MTTLSVALTLSTVGAVSAWWHERRRCRELHRVLAAQQLERQQMVSLAGWMEEERRALEMVADDAPLPEVLEAIALSLEHQSGDWKTSILLLDGTRLLHGAAPTLPAGYCGKIHGIEIGPTVGSCGTAAYHNEIVIVDDIATDPKWAAFQELAMSHGLRACWSFPIRSRGGHVIGTFAIYHPRQARPTEQHLCIAKAAAHLAAVAIESHRAGESLRRDAERMEIAEQAAQFGVWEAEVAGHKLTASPNLLALLDREELAAVEGWETLLALVDPADRQAVTRSVEVSFARGTHWRCECRVLRGDTSYRWFRIEGRIERDGDGRVVRLVGAAQDITAEQTALGSLEQSKRTAEEATKVKSQFLATMSHEIRTPLNGIIGTVNLLQDRAALREAAPYLETIAASSDALLRIVNDVLDFSKIEAGKIELENAPFSLARLLGQVQAIIEPQAHAKGLYLRQRVEPACQGRFYGDSSRLRQVLLNLLSNAVKFTAHGGVEVEVKAADRLIFRVSDTGIGMSHKQQEIVFAPFAQGDSSTTRRYGGTGLGLTISRHLVQLMGGTVRLESVPNHGTTFEVALPLEPATEEAPEPRCTGCGPSSRPMRLLLAEDNAINQRVASHLLERLGHTVVVVSNGVEAVEEALKSPFDAILMDCQMPELDGLSASAMLRERGFQRQIIALTANVLAEDRQRCLDAGMNDYLAKPITIERLRAVMEAAIQRSST